VKRAALVLLLCVACAHNAKRDGARELFSASGVPDDSKAALRAELEKLSNGATVEDVTPVWEALTIGDQELRFRTFTEPPPPLWPPVLVKPWNEALAVCKERLGPTPEKDRLGLISCNVELVEVLWNQFLEFKHAQGSVGTFWREVKKGEYEIMLERVVFGANGACELEDTPAAADVQKSALSLLRQCMAAKSSRPRLADTKMTLLAPGPSVVGTPPPKLHPAQNPKLETKVTATQLPRLELTTSCATRPATLSIDSWVAPSFSRLLEGRWSAANMGSTGSVECELNGDHELRAGAGALPLNVSTYRLECGDHRVSASVVTDDERWPEQVTRKLLLQLGEAYCPKGP
jgi:hypothetical protein